MRNRLYIILVFFLLYFFTYLCMGKNSLDLEIIAAKTYPQNQDSIRVHLYNLEDYTRNQVKVKTILKEKGFKKVTINYADNFLNKNTYSYWLETAQLTPFLIFANEGNFKINENSEEFESLYVWCFFKWIKVYKNKKPVT